MQEFQGQGDPLLTGASIKNVGVMVGGICERERNSFESSNKGGQGDPLFAAAMHERPSSNLDTVVKNLEVHKHHMELLNEIDHCRESKNLEHCLEERMHHAQLLDELEHLPRHKQD
jgi:hypothetical protein